MTNPHNDPPASERTRSARSSTRAEVAKAWVGRHRLTTAVFLVMLMGTATLVVRRRAPEGGGKPTSPSSDAMAGMSTDGAVHLTTRQLTTFGVTFGRVERRMLSTDVRTVGTVMIDEARVATVTPKISGYVERLFVNTTGQTVTRGAPLADVYSPDLIAAEEELLLARRLDRTVGESAVLGVPSSSGEMLAAARRRLRLWDVSDAQIEDVLRTGRARRTVTLFSPASGVVTEKRVTLGQAVQAGMELYRVADLSKVWVDAQVRETEAADLRVGSSADLDFATYPGRTYKGRVTFIYPTLANLTRSVGARVSVSNADGLLRPGMYATVRLSSPTRLALTVPRQAVVQTGVRALVFVDQGKGAFRPVDVTTGRSAGEFVEILAGLEPGQRVVTSAQFLLDSESNLAEVMKSMIGMSPGAKADGGPSGTNGPASDMKGMEMKGADTRGMPSAGAGSSSAVPR